MQDRQIRRLAPRVPAPGAVNSRSAGAAAPFALTSPRSAAAHGPDGGADYRALVCVFLYGGNDAYNMVLATDADSWAHYTAARNQAPDPIALAAGHGARRQRPPPVSRHGSAACCRSHRAMRRTQAAASRCIR